MKNNYFVLINTIIMLQVFSTDDLIINIWNELKNFITMTFLFIVFIELTYLLENNVRVWLFFLCPSTKWLI